MEARSILVEYFTDLQSDFDIPYPTDLGDMAQSGIDFEVSKLFEHIRNSTSCRNPYIMDVPQQEVFNLFTSTNDDIRVSALLSIIAVRLPQLELRSRV